MSNEDAPPVPSDAPSVPDEDASSVRRTFLRVMLVQAATMLLLWLLQLRYHG